ncbi:aroma-sacti cluster domain-containing protein [Streptomyces sp. NPDC048643]|uniref:aroma-sacti cluster domain-containing protein n=1 Tax=Streptomyces sp. NPDC048643 TaxID=3155637 RepID=UPI003439914A
MNDPVPDRDRLRALEDAGFPLHSLSPEQREVLGDLSTEELTLLLGLKERLDAAEPEVQAHSEIAGGALF